MTDSDSPSGESAWNGFIVAARAVTLFVLAVGVLATRDSVVISATALLAGMVVCGRLLGGSPAGDLE